MLNKTEKQIIEAFENIFSSDFKNYEKPVITICKNTSKEIIIIVKQMYNYVEMNLSHLIQIAEFFDTKHINDSRYSMGGCETCDYGSSYEISLTIKPE